MMYMPGAAYVIKKGKWEEQKTPINPQPLFLLSCGHCSKKCN